MIKTAMQKSSSSETRFNQHTQHSKCQIQQRPCQVHLKNIDTGFICLQNVQATWQMMEVLSFSYYNNYRRGVKVMKNKNKYTAPCPVTQEYRSHFSLDLTSFTGPELILQSAKKQVIIIILKIKANSYTVQSKGTHLEINLLGI